MAETAADKLRRLAEEQRRAADLSRQAKRLLGGGGRAYEEHKAGAAARAAAQSLAGRDIGDMPRVANWSRRRRATKSLRQFCEVYGAKAFARAWSDDHLRVLAWLEESVTTGGQFALAMPRGSGKTTMVAWATLWSMLTGRRRMVAIVVRGHHACMACRGVRKPAAAMVTSSMLGTMRDNAAARAEFFTLCRRA